MININNILSKKLKNKSLSKEEIYWFVAAAVNKKIKEYQISTMLTAIFFNGLSFDETYFLTLAMRDSGTKFNSKIKRIDKHSTGGVGDKVTIIISPILASFGIPIFKISGRGLGFTGGTIDKLESIGVETSMSLSNAEKVLRKFKLSIIEQTPDVVPADKIFYSIRNDANIVDSMPLIVSSIMSKKLALGANNIYLDIKIGSGALFPNLESAIEFSDICIKIGKKENKKVSCIFTDMNEPLGNSVGNKIEIMESLDFLQGNFKSKKLKELIFKIISDILIDFKLSNSFEESNEKILNMINSLNPFNIFVEWAKNQNSFIGVNDFKRIPFNPKYNNSIFSKKNGYFKIKSTSEIGTIVFDLGGGRIDKESSIDYDAGILFLINNGDKIKKNQEIIKVYSNSKISKEIIERISMNYEILDKPIKKNKIILGEKK